MKLLLEYQPNRVVYAVVYEFDGGTIYNTETGLFEPRNDSNWAAYVIPMSDAINTGLYTAQFPAVGPGRYNAIYHRQTGAAPTADDGVLDDDELWWNGATAVYLSDRSSIDYQTRAVREWQRTLAELWPEVVTLPAGEAQGYDPHYSQVRGVYVGEHVELIPLDKIEPPYAIVATTSWKKGQWGNDATSWEPWVEFYWVDECEGDPEEHRAKLTQLLKYLRPDSHAVDPLIYSQVIDIDSMDTNRALEINRALRRARSPLLGARLRVKMLVEDEIL